MGRPATPQEVVDLILRFAKENPTWGYDRIADALANLGHEDSDQTVGNILKANGIEPAPKRKRTTTWSTFLKAHWDQLAAIDFTTMEVWTQSGLVTYYLLFAMRLATRRVCFLGCTPHPVGMWMAQMARNLTDAFDGLLRAPVRYVLLDRDSKFTVEFRGMLKVAEVQPILLPPQSQGVFAPLSWGGCASRSGSSHPATGTGSRPEGRNTGLPGALGRPVAVLSPASSLTSSPLASPRFLDNSRVVRHRNALDKWLGANSQTEILNNEPPQHAFPKDFRFGSVF